MQNRIDLLLVGGGIANALLAWRLKKARESLRVVILEAEAEWPKNKNYLVRGSDLTAGQLASIRPLLSHSWAGTSVRLPHFARDYFGATFHVVDSSDFYGRLGIDRLVRFQTPVSSVSEHGVYLKDGTFLTASAVIDGRGPQAQPGDLRLESEFFEFDLRNVHGLTQAIEADFTVAQSDLLNCISVYPMNPKRIRMGQHRYLLGKQGVSEKRGDGTSRRWLERQGWEVQAVRVLADQSMPIPLSWPLRGSESAAPAIGERGGYFHYLNGASFAAAVELTEILAKLPKLDATNIRRTLRAYEEGKLGAKRFLLSLNRLLFNESNGERRLEILERLHRIPEPVLERLWADRCHRLDRMRLLLSRKPVPLRRAYRFFQERGDLNK